MDEYMQGQLDLIKKIKSDIIKMEEETDERDFVFDLIFLLKNIKPIEVE